ncbi:hypothetical protein B0O80DRAFT_448063 [Mortierella sp. GBAus27b]|nr:hypothetical protein B0O80DRAFT_448063 [Mortierella sp. GBAus27b]
MSLGSLYVHLRNASPFQHDESITDIYAEFNLGLQEDCFLAIVSKADRMNAEWSSTTLLADYNRSVQQELYISLSGIGPDGGCSVVRFTALPLDQVLQAPNETFKGIFDLYSLDGAQNGTVSLTISAAGPPAPNDQLEKKGKVSVDQGGEHEYQVTIPSGHKFQTFEIQKIYIIRSK